MNGPFTIIFSLLAVWATAKPLLAGLGMETFQYLTIGMMVVACAWLYTRKSMNDFAFWFVMLFSSYAMEGMGWWLLHFGLTMVYILASNGIITIEFRKK